MIPSRGIHALRVNAPRHKLFNQCRHLSSTPRPNLRSPLLQQTAGRARKVVAPAAISILGLPSVRHASTDVPAQNAPPPSELPSDFPNLDTINLDNLDTVVSSATHLPTDVGYLHSLGIDYGWGPTSMIQFVLENIHVHTGLPWWASILSTALILRAAAFPLFLRSSDSMARQAALSSVLKPYSEEVAAAKKRKDTQGMMLAITQQQAIRKRAGISTSAQLIPVVVQGVIGYCGFKLMKALVALPVPGLMNGGFLWLQDLTLTDGYLLLPLLMAGTMHVMARLGGESGAAQLPTQFKNIIVYVMPGIVAVVTAFQPGAVCLWFCGSGIIGLAQGQLLRVPAVRQFFRLAPIYTPKPGEEAQNPLMAMMTEQLGGKKSEPSSMPSGGAARGTGKRPGVAYMNPQYQAPNVQRSQHGGKTINAQLVSRTGGATDDMVQPGQKAAASKGGIFTGIKEKIDAAKVKLAEASKPTPEQERKAFKARAEAYEKRARERRR